MTTDRSYRKALADEAAPPSSAPARARTSTRGSSTRSFPCSAFVTDFGGYADGRAEPIQAV